MPHIPSHICRRVVNLREAVNSIAHAPGSSSFGPIFDQFMDLAEDAAFRDLGEADELDHIVPTLEALAKTQAISAPATVAILGAIRIPELGLRHGAMLFNGLPGGYFGFDDDNRIMVGWSRQDGQFQMTRITISPTKPGEVPDHLGSLIKGMH